MPARQQEGRERRGEEGRGQRRQEEQRRQPRLEEEEEEERWRLQGLALAEGMGTRDNLTCVACVVWGEGGEGEGGAGEEWDGRVMERVRMTGQA